jgi:hypothetical protein
MLLAPQLLTAGRLARLDALGASLGHFWNRNAVHLGADDKYWTLCHADHRFGD